MDVGASVDDLTAADEEPLVLPKSLLPEQVSVESIRREQGRDPFAAELARVEGVPRHVQRRSRVQCAPTLC